jgi:multimeric flavodoxin WrbA
MKIVCLLGSPRAKGNSSALAKRFCDTAKSLEAKVQTFTLNKLDYKGCQACMACKTKLDKCILKDDLEKVLEAIHHCHVLVLASPVYYGDVSSQLKAFIDRTFSYLTADYTSNAHPSRLSRGKKLVFILTQGQPDETQFDDIFPRYNYFFRWYGFETYLIRACGVMEAGDVEAHFDAMTLAEETARKMMR